MTVQTVHVTPRLHVHLHDDWEEQKHPRKQTGQFAPKGGGEMPAGHYKQVKKPLRKLLQANGFVKIKGKLTYKHATGVKVKFEPPGFDEKQSATWKFLDPSGGQLSSGHGLAGLATVVKNNVKQQPPEEKTTELEETSTAKEEQVQKPDPDIQGTYLSLFEEHGYELSPNGNGKQFKNSAGVTVAIEPGSPNSSWFIYGSNGYMISHGTGSWQLEGVLAQIKSQKKEHPTHTLSVKAGQPVAGKNWSATEPKAQEEQENPTSVINRLNKAAPEPTSSERAALAAYSGSMYRDINDCLRFLADCGHISGANEIKNYLARAALDKDTKLYRGVKGQYASALRAVLNKRGVGALIEDRGLISTSVDQEVAKNFAEYGNVMFHITAPAGANAAAIHQFSNHSSEREVLLQAGSHLEVTAWDSVTGIAEVTVRQEHLK